jgi:hypothetical protein
LNPFACGVKRVSRHSVGRKQKPPVEALARPPRAASLPMGPSLDPQCGMRRPASPTTFQALCQIAKIRILSCKINQIYGRVQFLTECFQTTFLLIRISIREFIVQRKK